MNQLASNVSSCFIIGGAPNGDCIISDHFKRGGKKVD